VESTPPIVWTPSPERVASATITRYREWLNDTRGLSLGDYADLWQWSVDDLEDFWASIWEFFEVDASEPYERVLTSRRMPGAEWFPGARLSYAEHVFRGREADDVAIRHASELRPLGEWTWGELRARAGAVAAALKEAGVAPGDRVAAYLPNIPETIAAFLGCASIGATWLSFSGSCRHSSRRSCCRISQAPTGSFRQRSSSSRSSRSTIRSGCSTARAPPACPRRSSTGRAGSSSST
jgi:acetoacetyl-CoA synthetase